VLPGGTIRVSRVEVAEVTAAAVAPKYTILSEGSALKLVPVIITVVPTAPEAGIKELIVG